MANGRDDKNGVVDAEGETTSVETFELNGWTLAVRPDVGDGKPVVSVELIAQRFDYSRPRSVNDLIERKTSGKNLNDYGVYRTPRQTSEQGGRPGWDYWVNEDGALWLVKWSDKPKANEAYRTLIAVLRAYEQRALQVAVRGERSSALLTGERLEDVIIKLAEIVGQSHRKSEADIGRLDAEKASKAEVAELKAELKAELTVVKNEKAQAQPDRGEIEQKLRRRSSREESRRCGLYGAAAKPGQFIKSIDDRVDRAINDVLLACEATSFERLTESMVGQLIPEMDKYYERLDEELAEKAEQRAAERLEKSKGAAQTQIPGINGKRGGVS